MQEERDHTRVFRNTPSGAHAQARAEALVDNFVQDVGHGLGCKSFALYHGEGSVQELHLHEALGGVEQRRLSPAACKNP